MTCFCFARSDTGQVLARKVRLARSLWARMKGLLGVKVLPVGEGIWLLPCNSIHMWGMRISIDAIFLDRDLRVLRVFQALRPGAVVWPVRGAHSVLELGNGTLERGARSLKGVRLITREVLD